MNSKQFTKVVDTQFKLCRDLLVVKAAEYAPVDRLANFRRSAVMQNVPLQQAVGGMMVKHTTSIYDMIERDTHFPIEVWEEKISDHINYLLLLKAAVIDQQSTVPE